MALATITNVHHLPMGERPQYGQPYPEGVAVASADVPDDASGGVHSFSFIADPGFLYRMELLNWTRGEATLRTLHAVTVHRWATGRAPVFGDAFDLNWFLGGVAGAGFAVYTLGGVAGGRNVMKELSRFPMGVAGGTPPGVAQQLLFLTNETNTDTITNEVSAIWTYWRKEALYLPGFLSAFYEAPAIPPLLRP